MKTKIIGTTLACAGLLTATACGGSDSGGDADGPVTVTVMTWESPETNAAIDKALAGFKDDKITVKRIDTPGGGYGDKLASLTQAKKLPDLFWCGNDTEQQYTSQGLLVDWSKRITDGSGAFKADSFVPSAMENWKTADGLMGGLPSLMNTYGVWYNADAFKAVGLAEPKAGWTWDDMYAAAGKLANKGGAKYGLVADQLTSPDAPFTMSLYSVSAGGAPFTDNVNHPTKAEADGKFTEGVGKLVDAIKSGAVAPPGYDAANAPALFSGGKVPMLFGGQWLAAGFQTDKPKIRYGFVPFPQVTTPTTLYDSVGICTPEYTASEDATYKVLEYLNTKVWDAVLPASPVAPPAYTPAQESYFNALTKAGQTTVVDTVKADLATEKTVGVRFTTQWASQVADLTTAYYQPILSGKKPVSELQTYVTKINDLIKQAG
ncbi:MAG TPA: extracellular solute-binding protein [Kribbella sp.]|uniref:ABC transporter substrate-binding protein n=1 Tax=Kribbella sp. TaxID=1871183 RepID=UPI002D78052D|nr:extracellular solute-binding protein [Kribbella sp.]HET6296096.1 extracellular solute-binding protein [Kribbella sp.]